MYVYSLQFTKLNKMETGFGMSLVKELIDKVKFWAPVHEYYSWGNAKEGKILFGAGKTFMLNGSGEIKPISSASGRSMLRADLDEADKQKYDEMINSVKAAMLDWQALQGEVNAAPDMPDPPED